jgi:hypothetical protein
MLGVRGEGCCDEPCRPPTPARPRRCQSRCPRWDRWGTPQGPWCSRARLHRCSAWTGLSAPNQGCLRLRAPTDRRPLPCLNCSHQALARHPPREPTFRSAGASGWQEGLAPPAGNWRSRRLWCNWEGWLPLGCPWEPSGASRGSVGPSPVRKTDHAGRQVTQAGQGDEQGEGGTPTAGLFPSALSGWWGPRPWPGKEIALPQAIGGWPRQRVYCPPDPPQAAPGIPFGTAGSLVVALCQASLPRLAPSLGRAAALFRPSPAYAGRRLPPLMRPSRCRAAWRTLPGGCSGTVVDDGCLSVPDTPSGS